MPDLMKKLFFDDDQITQNRGKSFTVCGGPASQSIGRGRISREEALDLRESRERRDKIFAEKTITSKNLDQKQQFSVGNFHFFGRGRTSFWGGI